MDSRQIRPSIRPSLPFTNKNNIRLLEKFRREPYKSGLHRANLLSCEDMRQEKLGGLTVRITGGTDGRGGGNGPVVVLLHGYGAPGEDLVVLGEYLDAPAGTRYVFPAAPIPIPLGYGDSRGWWIIDMAKIQADRAAGRIRDMSGEIPAGLVQARERVAARPRARCRRRSGRAGRA